VSSDASILFQPAALPTGEKKAGVTEDQMAFVHAG
jgi:hypothetical protein